MQPTQIYSDGSSFVDQALPLQGGSIVSNLTRTDSMVSIFPSQSLRQPLSRNITFTQRIVNLNIKMRAYEIGTLRNVLRHKEFCRDLFQANPSSDVRSACRTILSMMIGAYVQDRGYRRMEFLLKGVVSLQAKGIDRQRCLDAVDRLLILGRK